MKGLDLSRKYYELYGREMIAALFPSYAGRIAVGLAGAGSDCFGYDDEVSRDHDFGAGFCLWLTDGDYEKIGFDLIRAYGELPDSLDGIAKAKVFPDGSRHFGVMKISDFFLPLTGSTGAPENLQQWLSVPDSYLACAVNGEIFRDDLGIMTGIREEISNGMPEDVKLKKIAARAIGMAQSGQYNFPRCIKHGEYGAAALALSEFVRETAALAYLLNGKFCPFYKWALRGMKDLELFADMSDELSDLLTEKTDASQIEKTEKIAERFADYFRSEGLSKCADNYLEPHAYEIRNRIKNPILRNAHIMEG